ncbi:MAG: hypothetical protein HY080_13910 [Gammaproteobacteria bacterium]|nr:hypothetical protein [Gammaproteobacteria bacterium]
MIIPRYSIAPSRIPQAGQGVFLAVAVSRGSVLVAPDRIQQTLTHQQFEQLADPSQLNSSVRWFEQHYTVCPEWDDECYINHSFSPTGLWHLGFVFAMDELPVGTELTMDYRYILGENCQPAFIDSLTQQPIIGLPWQQVITDSTRCLLSLLPAPR